MKTLFSSAPARYGIMTASNTLMIGLLLAGAQVASSSRAESDLPDCNGCTVFGQSYDCGSSLTECSDDDYPNCSGTAVTSDNRYYDSCTGGAGNEHCDFARIRCTGTYHCVQDFQMDTCTPRGAVLGGDGLPVVSYEEHYALFSCNLPGS